MSNHKKIGINMNPKNATHVKAFTIENSDLILRLMTSVICTSGWMFLIPRKGGKRINFRIENQSGCQKH